MSRGFIVAWTVRVAKEVPDNEEPWEYIERYRMFDADEWKNPQQEAIKYYGGIRFPENRTAPDAVKEGEILWAACVAELIDKTNLI